MEYKGMMNDETKRNVSQTTTAQRMNDDAVFRDWIEITPSNYAASSAPTFPRIRAPSPSTASSSISSKNVEVEDMEPKICSDGVPTIRGVFQECDSLEDGCSNETFRFPQRHTER